MAGSGVRRGGRATVAAAIVLAGAWVGPPPTAAADDPTMVLPGAALTAVTVDLDGDGDREIVRLIQEAQDLDHEVDAWEQAGTGWAMIGSAPMPRATGVQDGGRDGRDAVTLLRVEAAGRERVLAFSAGQLPDDPNGATCCLTIWEVQLTVDGQVDIRLVRRVGGGAESIQAADLDGDGSDDLVLLEYVYGDTEDEQTATLTVLRRTVSGFEPAFEMTDPQLMTGLSVGDSDGVPGDDLQFGPTIDGRIHRLAWADGGMELDESPIDAGGPREGWVVGVADGAIVLSLGEEVRAVRWPRDEVPEIVSRLPTLVYPGLSLIGDGPEALVVVQSNFAFENGEAPTTTLHDLALRPLGEVASGAGTEGVWRLVSGQRSRSTGSIERNVYPYMGPIHGLVDGRPAYVSSGMLIQPGGPEGYEARPMASLFGVQPIGLAGPQDGWAVIADGYSAPPGAAYLYWGGVPTGWGRLTVTPWERLLQPDDEVAAASFELIGAVEVAGVHSSPTLLAEPDGFQVAITAPQGSTAIVVNGVLIDEQQVGAQPLNVEIPPPANRQDEVDVPLDAMVFVITPDGRGTSREWTGTFVREPPEISLTASTNVMALSATLIGTASPGSDVRANGVAIETDDAGRFQASIDAPIWPSRVVVTARDPLGNEAAELVEVVGMVDYRGLPWGAILVAITLLVGGVLYLRTPKRRAVASLPDGDGRLEELELDALDGIEPGGR